MRVAALDDLAVELEHQPKDAVRGRVLRAEVDVEVADPLLGREDVVPARAARLAVAVEVGAASWSRRSRSPSMRGLLSSPWAGPPGAVRVALLVARQREGAALPGGQEVELAVFLHQRTGS